MAMQHDVYTSVSEFNAHFLKDQKVLLHVVQF